MRGRAATARSSTVGAAVVAGGVGAAASGRGAGGSQRFALRHATDPTRPLTTRAAAAVAAAAAASGAGVTTVAGIDAVAAAAVAATTSWGGGLCWTQRAASPGCTAGRADPSCQWRRRLAPPVGPAPGWGLGRRWPVLALPRLPSGPRVPALPAAHWGGRGSEQCCWRCCCASCYRCGWFGWPCCCGCCCGGGCGGSRCGGGGCGGGRGHGCWRCCGCCGCGGCCGCVPHAPFRAWGCPRRAWGGARGALVATHAGSGSTTTSGRGTLPVYSTNGWNCRAQPCCPGPSCGLCAACIQDHSGGQLRGAPGVLRRCRPG